MASKFLVKLFGLSGQAAVVIGGTGKLGGAIAGGLANAGATVVVAGRCAERGEKRVRKIKRRGGKAFFVLVDVTSRDSLENLLASVLERAGRVDMLVNSAGVNAASPYLEANDDDWGLVLNHNLRGVHWACQIVGRHMVESASGGAILNIASVTAHIPLSRVFAYSASKAAVVNLTQNIAREFAPFDIRVNALCPGFFPAEQNRRILTRERMERIHQQTPMYRYGKAKELIGPALLLLSRKAGSFVTGSSLYVDGGFTAMRF